MTNEQAASKEMMRRLREAASTALDMSPGDPVAAWAVSEIERLSPALEPRACLCDESLALLRQMRDEHIANGTLSGRMQRAAEDMTQKLASRAAQPPASARCHCGAQEWPPDCVQIEDSRGRLHTLRGCQPGATSTKEGEQP
jgi:hypothetical protein